MPGTAHRARREEPRGLGDRDRPPRGQLELEGDGCEADRDGEGRDRRVIVAGGAEREEGEEEDFLAQAPGDMEEEGGDEEGLDNLIGALEGGDEGDEEDVDVQLQEVLRLLEEEIDFDPIKNELFDHPCQVPARASNSQ